MNNKKIIILIYVFTAVFAYLLSLRANNLEKSYQQESYNGSVALYNK